MNEKYLGTATYKVTSKGIEILTVIPKDFATHHNISGDGTCEIKISDFRGSMSEELELVAKDKAGKKYILDVLSDLERTHGKTVPLASLEEAIVKNSGWTLESFKNAIERLKLQGDVFEPKRNYISRII